MEIDLDDPWCYMPLWKKHKVAFRATATIWENQLDDNGNIQSLNVLSMISGSLKVRALGPVSCHRLRERIGEIVGSSIAADVRKLVSSLP